MSSIAFKKFKTRFQEELLSLDFFHDTFSVALMRTQKRHSGTPPALRIGELALLHRLYLVGLHNFFRDVRATAAAEHRSGNIIEEGTSAPPFQNHKLGRAE